MTGTSATAAAPATGRVKVLVVDDEPDLSLLFRQRFRRQIGAGEMEFVFAANGLEALRTVEHDGDVDIVVTDINMPVMDGLTLLGELKSRPRLHRAVVMSAYDDLANIRAAMNRGAFDFITKPIDFQDLETTLGRTMEQVRGDRRASEARRQLQTLQHELDIARTIQRSILPDSLPRPARPDGVEIAGRMLPAAAIGGDFYDHFTIDADRIGFVIGDVSGKGVAAALFMAMTRTLVRASGQAGASAQSCVAAANRMLTSDNATTMFVSAFYGIMNRRTGELDFCNAGHTPVLVVRDGVATPLPTETNLVLGIEADYPYIGGRHQCRPGEALVLSTDGVTEAENVAGEFYGLPRLRGLLARIDTVDPSRILDAVLADVRSFTGAGQTDDITVLALEWRGGEGPGADGPTALDGTAY